MPAASTPAACAALAMAITEAARLSIPVCSEAISASAAARPAIAPPAGAKAVPPRSKASVPSGLRLTARVPATAPPVTSATGGTPSMVTSAVPSSLMLVAIPNCSASPRTALSRASSSAARPAVPSRAATSLRLTSASSAASSLTPSTSAAASSCTRLRALASVPLATRKLPAIWRALSSAESRSAGSSGLPSSRVSAASNSTRPLNRPEVSSALSASRRAKNSVSAASSAEEASRAWRCTSALSARTTTPGRMPPSESAEAPMPILPVITSSLWVSVRRE